MDGGGADRPTPAIDGVAGRRPGLSLFSGPVCAAVFVSFALCIIIFCIYSFLARRHAIFTARDRFFRSMRERDIEVPGWSANSNSGPGDFPVCLEPLQYGSNIMAAHACGHVFHAPCIEPWIRQGGTCHVCRCTINPTFTSNFTSGSTLIPTPASNSNSSAHVPVPVPPPPPQQATTQSNSISTTSIGDDCPVCIEPLRVGGGNIRGAAHASVHVFHSRCIDSWLHQQGSCPVCRCTINSTFTSHSNSTFTSNPIPNPTFNSKFNSTANSSSSTVGDCPVCLDPLRVDSGAIRTAHACGHVLHSRCIEQWLRGRGSCPVCRCTVNHDSNSNSVSNTSSTSTSNSNSSPIGGCSVCLEPLRVPGGDVRAVHVCGHMFHSRCIEQWLRRRNSCPVCRCTVRCRCNPRNEVASAAAASPDVLVSVVEPRLKALTNRD